MTQNDGHGLAARKPSQFPLKGWKEILARVFSEISDDRVMLIAAGVTYYLLLALIPALSAIVSTYGLVADPATIREHTASLQGFIPGGGMDILNQQMERLTSQKGSTLGLTFVVSLAIALWSANAGMKSLFQAMNVAYDEEDSRSFVQLTLVSFVFTVAAIVALLALIGAMIVLPVILSAVGLGSATEWTIQIASYVGVVILLSLGIAALHRWGPSRKKAKWRWITPGTALSVVFIAAVSFLFSWYVSNFGSYNETYGSLGALIGFLTWIWLTVTILIVGGELNSEMEHQTAKDTTTAPARPLGSRGAYMADHVASRETANGTPEGLGFDDERGSAGSDYVGVALACAAGTLPAVLLHAWLNSGRRR